MQTTAPPLDSLLQTAQAQRIRRASITVPRRWQWRFFVIALVINDILMTGFAFRLAYLIRFELGFDFFSSESIPTVTFYQNLVVVILPVWFFIFTALGLYNRKYLLGGTREYSLVFNGATIGMFALIAAGFLLPELVFARGWLIIAWGLSFFFIALGRFTLRRVIYSLRQWGFFLAPAVIVGANDEGFSLAQQLVEWRASGLHIMGFVDKKFPAGTLLTQDLYALGTVDQLPNIVNKYQVEEIILATSAFTTRDSLLDIFKTYGVASGVNVRMSSGLYEIITTGLTVKEFANVPLVGINQVRLSPTDRLMKSVMDYSLTIPALIFLFPLFVAIGIAIKLDSPGPVFHRRKVLGVNGREFFAWKFRTMIMNGDELIEANPALKAELEANYKLKNDPRITKLGHFLRKWSLDELPQLFNVLLGDMSWVGPRMITCPELDKYQKWDINLLTVRPGITGLWQVSGRSDVSYEQRVSYDMYYVRNWTIWLDLQLLFQTIPAVLKKRGAY